MFDLKGGSEHVTGGASANGAATARAFIQAGAQAIIVDIQGGQGGFGWRMGPI